MGHVDANELLAEGGGYGAQPTVAFVTLGCAKNEVDSAAMVDRVQAAGFTVTDDPRSADAVVVNTCSFIQAATEESLQTIFEISGLPGYDDGSKGIVVAGCLPARYGEDLEQDLTEASAFVPCSRESDIVEVLADLLGAPARIEGGASRKAGDFFGTVARYVKISDGCDRFCSFCAIPYIRGAYHSFQFKDIRDEVSRLVSDGAREITLIAQDTGRWGEDLNPEDTTASLLERLADEFADTWFRLMYVEPAGVTDQLLETIASHPNICSYLDVPLQHASAKVLDSMNRSGSYEENLALIRRIRAKVPGITLRTTVIAGFPGETEEDFDLLVDFLEEAEFDYVGVFAYSREEGTRAASLPDQVDEDVKAERAQTLRDVADSISHARVASRAGQSMDVLVLGREEDGQLYGRAMCQAPDVDGVTYLESGEPGDVVRIVIEDTLLYEMEGA